MERETGIEPATNSLEGCDSTIELLPPVFIIVASSLRAAAQQHGFKRVENDVRIERGRQVFDVVQIVFKLDDGVLDGVAVLVVDLRPAGDSRFDAQALAVIRNLLLQDVDEL